MFPSIRSALLGIGALAATAASLAVPAHAAPLANGPVIEIQYRGDWDDDRGPRERRHWDGPRGPRFDDDRRARGGRCAPGLALEKARAFGLRGVDIVDVGRRRVVVEGFRRGGRPVLVSFAQARGCPVLDRR